MIRSLFLISTILILSGCGQSAIQNSSNEQEQSIDTVPGIIMNQPLKPVYPADLLSKADAEKILGEPTHLKDSATTFKRDTLEYKCSYFANSKDLKSRKTGAIYFLYEEFVHDSSSKKKYSFIKTANENHEGVKALTGMGDEAYFHSDGENFYFIIARKGRRMFNMKVNKITSTTSLDEFNRVARNITAAL